MLRPLRLLTSAAALVAAAPGVALAGGTTDAVVGNPTLVTAAAMAMAFVAMRLPRRRG